MAYPQGFLLQPPVPLALHPPGSGVAVGPRTEEFGRSSSGSAFAPYSSSAVSRGFNARLPYGGEPRAAASLSSFMSPSYDTSVGLSSLDYHPFGTLGVGGGHHPSYGDPGYRKNATRDATATLKAWLHEHRKNPYPTKGEKIMLAIITKMTLTQVSTWFANARRRLKKENKMTWTPRTRSEGEEDGEHVDREHLQEEQEEEASRHLTDSSSLVFRGMEDLEPGFGDLDFNDTGSGRTAHILGPRSASGSPPPAPVLRPLGESEHTSSPSKDQQETTRGPNSNSKPKLWSLVELATSGTESKGGSDTSWGGGAGPGTAYPQHLYYASAFFPGFSSYASVRPQSGAGAPMRPPSCSGPGDPPSGSRQKLLQAEMAAARDSWRAAPTS